MFSAVFHIGRNHGKFTVHIIEEVSPEVSWVVMLFYVLLQI